MAREAIRQALTHSLLEGAGRSYICCSSVLGDVEWRGRHIEYKQRARTGEFDGSNADEGDSGEEVLECLSLYCEEGKCDLYHSQREILFYTL